MSFQMLGTAQTLAAQIESGNYSELMPHQRTELRQLAMTIHAWSDQVVIMEVDRLYRHRRPVAVMPIARLIRRFLRG